LSLALTLAGCVGAAGTAATDTAQLADSTDDKDDSAAPPSQATCDHLNDHIWDICIPDDDAPIDVTDCLTPRENRLVKRCCQAFPKNDYFWCD
jgi:hypothetical protein